MPDAVAEVTGPVGGHLVKLYFSFILVLEGIIGMSLLNSIFVDAMVSDNNDELKEQLDKMEQKIDALMEQKKDE